MTGNDGTAGTIVLANAPVSYGAFEITVGIDPNVPEPLTLLDWVHSAGYDGIDLGPVGYLGDADTLPARLAERELGLVGGYLELPFSEPDRITAELANLEALLDIFDAVSGQTLAPKPTLADAGSEIRSRYRVAPRSIVASGWTMPVGPGSPTASPWP